MNKLILLLLLFITVSYVFVPNPTPIPHRQNLSKFNRNYDKIGLNWINIPKIILFGFGLVSLFWLTLLHFCNQVKYITFNTNLTLSQKKSKFILPQLWLYLFIVPLWLLLIEYPEDFSLQFFLHYCSNFALLMNLDLNVYKCIARSCFHSSCVFIFTDAISPETHILSIFVFQIWCHKQSSNVPKWLPFLLLLMANDVELNPGPPLQNQFFSFMNWNLNSLVKENFGRVGLIEAHNAIFDYDLISVCETNLNDSIEIPDPLLKDYNFISSNHPGNVSHGGVGLFYKDSLPVIHRRDLSFDECIVIELKFGRKKIFFTVLYRSPASKHGSPDFELFLSNFKNLHTNIMAENPFATFFTGDFNGHSQFWWPEGDTNAEGSEIEDLLTSLNLSQIISEPTNFTPNKRPTCIDLIATDQPNLVLDSGCRASLDSTCHHQIIYCKVNFKIPPPPPIERRVWHYSKANITAIHRSMSSFPWVQHFRLNSDVNWQAKSFTEIVLNIMSNFVPNEVKKMIPRDPPWLTKPLKTMLKKKNRLFKSYKKHGYKDEDKLRLQTFRNECQLAVETAKLSYLSNLGNKLNDPGTPQKCYWKIIHRVMNKSRAPRIPPLLLNNSLILNLSEKAKTFNAYFANQCSLILNDSVLPPFYFVTDKIINDVPIRNDEILKLIRNLNPNKATGSDGISGQMLLLCDDSVVPPLKIIFQNILDESIYPDIWKLANVTPIHKKEDKQLVKNYRPISLLPICGKIFEKIIFNNLYSYLNANKLLTKNQSGFRPGDSTTNQLLYLVSEIHEAFEDSTCLEVRAVFLDISKAFDKVWHDGLIFKLKQNGVSGKLLKFFESYLINRRQRVMINGFYSDYVDIESGVPQGSVLGPLLFLVYINDLEKNIKSNVKFFADDTMLYSVVKNPTITAVDLNHDLDIINQWAYQWKMKFNPDPTKQAKEVLFSCKKKIPSSS